MLTRLTNFLNSNAEVSPFDGFHLGCSLLYLCSPLLLSLWSDSSLKIIALKYMFKNININKQQRVKTV